MGAGHDRIRFVTMFLPEIFGLEEPRAQLQRWWQGDHFPVGLLLTGQSGHGKKTLALAMARVLLTDSDSGEASSFSALNHPDLEVVEPTGAARLIGIAQIRELRERFSLTGAGGRRVGIIAPADALTEESSNALLKLLEEPPSGTHLILTARARDSIMETLVSRCRVLKVPSAGVDATSALLLARGISPDRAGDLALLSDGRPGIAIRLAEPEGERVLAATRLLLNSGAPLSDSKTLAAELKEDASSLEAQRFLLRGVLDMAGRGLSAALRASFPSPSPEAARIVMLLEIPLFSAPRIEAMMRRLVVARADIDKNIAPDLLLSSLLDDWRAASTL